jgi:hypothetical protein
LAANFCFSFVNGLMPSRAVARVSSPPRTLAKPGSTKAPFFFQFPMAHFGQRFNDLRDFLPGRLGVAFAMLELLLEDARRTRLAGLGQ